MGYGQFYGLDFNAYLGFIYLTLKCLPLQPILYYSISTP